MTVDHIATLNASNESETLEFKETTGTCCWAAKTMCAFLNQHGRRTLFGVQVEEDVGGNKGTLLNYWNNLDRRILNSGNSITSPTCSLLNRTCHQENK